MRIALALATCLLVASPTLASAGADNGGGLTVTSREELSATPTACETKLAFSRGAEGSPAVVADRNRVTAVWQQDVAKGAGAGITTAAATLSNGLGGPCGRLAGGREVTMPALAIGPDGRTWTAVSSSGSGGSQVLLSDGLTAPIVVDELVGVPTEQTEFLPTGVAVDGHVVHVTYIVNVAPFVIRGLHRSYDTRTGVLSAAHQLSAGATPATYDFREQLVALGGGKLLALSTEVDPPGLVGTVGSLLTYSDLTQAPIYVRARRFADAGVTWSLPEVVLTLANGAVRDPAPGDGPNTALRSLIHPSVAVGPDGRVHVAAESVQPSGTTQILTRSTADGGGSWSGVTSVARPGIALHATVAVDGRGDVALSWLDVDVNGPGLPAVWRAVAVGGSDPVEVSAPFSLRALAPAYVGDQGAMVGLPKGFASVNVVGTGDTTNPTRVELVRLR